MVEVSVDSDSEVNCGSNGLALCADYGARRWLAIESGLEMIAY